jgi:hypothetical protein
VLTGGDHNTFVAVTNGREVRPLCIMQQKRHRPSSVQPCLRPHKPRDKGSASHGALDETD